VRSSRNYSAMQIKVGTLLTIATAIALVAMIFPTKGVNPFSPKFKLITYFPAVAGLRPSSPVWFCGVEVGEVVYVDFVPNTDSSRLKVVMRIERKVQPYIKTDSKAEIKGMGLLGDMFIDISCGSEDADMVRNKSVIAGVPPKSMKKDLAVMMTSAKGLLQNLEQISLDIREGRGSLGQLAQDPSLYCELRDAVCELKAFAKVLNEEEGTAKKLIKDSQLYDELVAAVQDIRTIVADLKQTEEKLLSPDTKKKIDQTVETAARVVKRVGEYQEKIDRLRFDLSFGLNKYEGNVVSGHAHLRIWPNEDRYYVVGLQKVTDLYGYETDRTTLEAQLAWRILETPLFIRGGLIKDEFFVAGLDLRLFADDFSVMLDAYRIEYDPIQIDMRLGVIFLDLIELTAGVEDFLHQPFYKAGLTIHYRDDDLLTVLMKAIF